MITVTVVIGGSDAFYIVANTTIVVGSAVSNRKLRKGDNGTELH